MNVKELFSGIAVIFDDEIFDDRSGIHGIKESIESEGIPVAAYSEPPKIEYIASLAKASFVVLDWEFGSGILEDKEERIVPGSGLKDSLQADLISFVQEMLKEAFVPIFIFTNRPVEEIEDKLAEQGIDVEDYRGRIYIKSKSELNTAEKLFQSIEEWLNNASSLYVLKQWELQATQAKISMFNDLYSGSSRWADVVWNRLKADGIGHEQEFGDFISRNQISRMNKFDFDENMFDTEAEASAEELREILHGERFMTYDPDELPLHLYTGDLYKENKTRYWLCVSAQCDLMDRPGKEISKDQEIYFLRGRKIPRSKIAVGNPCIDNEGNVVMGKKQCISKEELELVTSDANTRNGINSKIKDMFKSPRVLLGAFLDRSDKFTIAGVGHQDFFQFELRIKIFKRGDIEQFERLGRILPPYITAIQKAATRFIVRDGFMPIPNSYFE